MSLRVGKVEKYSCKKLVVRLFKKIVDGPEKAAVDIFFTSFSLTSPTM